MTEITINLSNSSAQIRDINGNHVLDIYTRNEYSKEHRVPPIPVFFAKDSNGHVAVTNFNVLTMEEVKKIVLQYGKITCQNFKLN